MKTQTPPTYSSLLALCLSFWTLVFISTHTHVLAGGEGSALNSVQVASSAAVFERGPDIPVARMGHHVATLPDGRAALFGGHGQGFVSLSSASFWVPGEHTFSSKTMNQTRDTPVFTRLADGRFLLAGGSSNLGVPAYAHSEIYDPIADTFTASGNMVRFRSNSSGTALTDGRVLIAGAWWIHNDAHTYGELFNPVSGNYQAVGPFGVARSHAIVMPMNDGSGVIVGGIQPRGSFQDMPVEHYNPANGAITVLHPLLFPGEPGWQVSFGNRLTAAQEMSDGRFLWMATRAEGGVTHYRLFTFDPADGAVEPLPLSQALPDSSSGALMQVLVDAPRHRAYILVLVPQSSGHHALEVISINTNTGTMVRSSNSFLPGYSLGGAGLQVLADGKIFVTGGSADGSNFNPVDDTLLITAPEVVTTYWYSNASHLGEGWRWFDWFKSFKPVEGGWMYHELHGWLYALGDDPSGLFLWDGALNRWLWTSEAAYPWLYAFGADGGWVFFFENGSPGARFFARGSNGQIVSEEDLSL